MADLENQNLDPNRPPEEFQPGGGKAITPKNKQGGGIVDGVTERGKDKLAKRTGKAAGGAVGAALVSTGVGTALAGVGKWVTKRAAELATKWGLKDGNWLKVALAPIISLILMFTIGAVAIAGIVKANKGGFGNSQPDYLNIGNSDDADAIRFALGQSHSLQGNLKDWYFNQGDDRWADTKLEGWTRGGFSKVGCAITSATMVVNFYGITITPPNFGKWYVDKNGNALMGDPSLIASFMNQSDFGFNKKVLNVENSAEAINTEIDNGNPILASGFKTFGSSQTHYVVIAGISEDGEYIMLNDPVKGSGVVTRLELDKITNLWVLHDK